MANNRHFTACIKTTKMFTVTRHNHPKNRNTTFFFEFIRNVWQHTNASDRLQTHSTVLKFVNFYFQVSTHT